MPARAQKFVVLLAFLAAALSLLAVALRVLRDGALDATPLLGGLFMLALGIAGYRRLRTQQP